MIGIDWNVSFIGREKELKIIQEQLNAWGTRCMIFIAGEGGIGKTRLLHEVERYFDKPDSESTVKILPIFDFDDDQFKFAQNVGVSIGRHLDRTAFDPYLEALRKIRIMEEDVTLSGQEAAYLRRQTMAVNRLFVECFNKVSRKQRILLRIDTTDAIQNTVAFSYIYAMGAKLENTLILVAGRDAKELYEKYKEGLGDDAVFMPLQPFALADSRAYLAEKQKILKVTLPQEWMEKLFILAAGLPVLIDLAIEWAANHRLLPWMEQLALVKLQELQQRATQESEAHQHLSQLREQFKQVVVFPISDLRTKLDQLKFVLAKVYPLDLEGIMEMLSISQEDAQRLIEQAGKSVAIKVLPDGRLKLHDEVQRLIDKYLWLLLDQDGQWEIRDSRRAIAYLQRKSDEMLVEIRDLKQQEKKYIEAADPAHVIDIFSERREKEGMFWSLRLESLRRQLAIDIQTGYEYFQQDYELLREEYSSPSYREGLLTAMSPYAALEHPQADIHGNTLSKDQRLQIQRERALQARFDGLYQQAADIYEQLLHSVPPESEDYIKVLIGQANQLVRIGKLREAIRLTEQALALSEQIRAQHLRIQSTLEIGWIHRLMGNLGQARQYYTNALKLAFEYDDKERIALIYNNIAYVHALEHQERAFDMIEQAIRLWKELAIEREENRFRLGQCYNIAGEICLEMGHPEDSLPYFELSWSIFSQEERQRSDQTTPIAEWSSKARSGRGFACWQLAVAALRKRESEATQRYLQDAQFDLEWAEERCTDVDSPIILQRLGEVHFLLHDYPSAEKIWKQGMKESEQIGDALNEFRNLVSLARLAFYHSIQGFSDWQDFEHYYKFSYRRRYQVHFQNVAGLFYTYLGHLALQTQDISNAVSLYQRGLPPLAETIAYHPFTLTDQLDFIEQEILPHLSHEMVRQFGKSLQSYWLEGMHDMIALNYFREWSDWKGSEQKRTGGRHV